MREFFKIDKFQGSLKNESKKRQNEERNKARQAFNSEGYARFQAMKRNFNLS